MKDNFLSEGQKVNKQAGSGTLWEEKDGGENGMEGQSIYSGRDIREIQRS